MKKLAAFILVLIASVALIWTAISIAQMKGMMGNSDQSGTQSDQHQRFVKTMSDMSNHQDMVISEYDTLQQDFGRIMNMNDVSEMKLAMSRHREMMLQMRNSLTAQHGLIDQALSLMDSMGVKTNPGMMNMPDHNNGQDDSDQNNR